MHILNNLPCEDFSYAYSADRYHIAVIADGHGAKSCFRSKTGSRIAVEVATDNLIQLAGLVLRSTESEEEFYKYMFSNPRSRKMEIRHLTDTIVADWYSRISEDYKENPPSVYELGDELERADSIDRIEHIYGTTLIAVLWLPKCLILLQQGDGRCDVFYGDGTVDQPIPWDDRCMDYMTTSMCDEDVAVSFRSSVINLEKKPVIACYLGCDGIEDAYRDTYEDFGGSHVLMGGVHTFYKEITRQIVTKGNKKFERQLKVFLEKFSKDGIFSRSGSGDDVSIAGIVDTAAVVDYAKQYECDIKYYDLEEKLFWKQDELRGKTRKHDILEKRLDKAKQEYLAAKKTSKGKGKKVDENEKAEKKKAYDAAKKAFELYDEKYRKIENDIEQIKNELNAL